MKAPRNDRHRSTQSRSTASEEGSELSSDDATAPDGATAKVPFDTSVAHQARMYDYMLGSKGEVLHTP